MCYIFRQICPFNSELRKDKIATCLLLPPAFILSPPTFWEARDQPEPGSFFPRMKDPGNEVVFVGPAEDNKQDKCAKDLQLASAEYLKSSRASNSSTLWICMF